VQRDHFTFLLLNLPEEEIEYFPDVEKYLKEDDKFVSLKWHATNILKKTNFMTFIYFTKHFNGNARKDLIFLQFISFMRFIKTGLAQILGARLPWRLTFSRTFLR
jgi:hypothetical protein